jgi:hypothetical protein
MFQVIQTFSEVFSLIYRGGVCRRAAEISRAPARVKTAFEARSEHGV